MSVVTGVGVIGTGFGALVTAPAFAAVPDATVRVICGRRRDHTTEVAERLGATVTDDPEELLAREDVDLVCVTTPPHTHHDLVLLALEAHKHVLCEKPFGLDPGEAASMLQHARDATRLHFVDFEFRTLPARRHLGALVRGGTLGSIEQVVITAMVAGRKFPILQGNGWWQRRDQGGGWLGAMGSHYVDAVLDWFGDIDTVRASLRRPRHPSDDPVAADVGFLAEVTTVSGTAISIVSTSTIGAPIGPRIEVYGTLGTAVLESEQFLTTTETNGTCTTTDFGDPEGGHGHPSRAPHERWSREIISAIRVGVQVAPSFEDGLRCQQVLAALRRSADNSGIVTAVDATH